MFRRTGDEMKKLKTVKNITLLLVGCLLILAAVIPSGTFSFFSSSKATYSTLAIGSCKQNVNSDVNYQLNDLIPGQEPQKLNINIQNDGTLLINHLVLTTSVVDVKNKPGKTVPGQRQLDSEFLSHFSVDIVSNNQTIKSLPLSKLNEGIDLTQLEQLNLTKGLDVGESLNIDLLVKFNKKNENQAKFENWSLSTKFFIEGTC
ncbi:TasA family protein [Niallia sp. Krafla_26]|uniref:TasA family protein n=1 Tax=Niallia sp. Krafla_26 TaxID=3064703 RepID=UPI003D17406F